MFSSSLRDTSLVSVLEPDDVGSPLAIAVKNAEKELPKPIKAVIQRQTERVLKLDKTLTAEEKHVAAMKDRLLYQRVTKHLAIEERVEMLNADVREGLDKSMRSAQTLANLEGRILQMRQMLRQQDATADVDIYGRPAKKGADARPMAGPMTEAGPGSGAGGTPIKGKGKPAVKSSADLVEDELAGDARREGMEDCPKCGRAFLLGFLRRHLEECDGVRAGDDSEEEDDDDEEASDGGAKGDKEAMAAREARLAKQRGQMAECPVCVRKFAAERIEKHVISCRLKETRRLAKLEEEKKSRVDDPAALAAMRANAVPPKPPQKVRHLACGPTTIPLLWDAPLFDGGAPILEYEIEYSVVEHKKVSRRETRREEVPQPTVSTSRWCMFNPVANRGWTLSGLPGGTELTHIRVRAVNEKGRGDWSEEIASVKTLPAVPASPPLHFRLSDEHPVTTASFTVVWEEPIDNGGDRIAAYEVRYNAQVPDFDASVRNKILGSTLAKPVQSGIATMAVSRSMRVPAPANLATVNGLYGPMTYSDITVVAISGNGLISAPAIPIPTVRTLPMSKLEHLTFELTEKKNMAQADVPIIDRAGVVQVVNRMEYIKQLEDELHKLKESGGDEGTQVEGQVQETSASSEGAGGGAHGRPTLDTKANGSGSPGKSSATNANSNYTGLSDEYVRQVAVRRKHFEQRIAVLQARVDDLSDNFMRHMERRAQLKHVLVQADRRYRVLKAEYEQVKNYKGRYIDSGVMHGRNQRFPADTLRSMIVEEMEEVAHALAQGKREMVAVVEDMDSTKAARVKAEDALKERKAAHLAFEKEEARKAKAAKFAARMNQASVYRCFSQWKDMIATKKLAQSKMGSFMARWGNLALARGFRQWWKWVESERAAEKLKSMQDRDDALPGLGSALLIAAERQRMDAAEDATSMLTWLRRVETALDSSDADLAYRRKIKDPDIAVIQPRGGPAVRAAAAAAAAARENMSNDGLVLPLVAMTLPVSATIGPDGELMSHPLPVLRLVDKAMPQSQEANINGQNVANAAEARMAADITMEGQYAVVMAQAASKAALESKGADAILEGQLKDDVEAHARGLLARAEAYMRSGESERALLALKRAEMVYGWRKDTKGLLATYRLLATLLEKVNRHDLGILHWDRCLQMAKEHEVSDVLAAAEAHEGRGRCLSARQCHEEALTAFERAEDIHDSRDDQPAIARILKLQAYELDMTGRPLKAHELRHKAEEIEHRLSTLITKGIQRLVEMENNLIGLGLAGSRVTNLEAVGPAVPLIRQQMKFIEQEVFKLRAVEHTTKQVVDREERRYNMLDEEAARAESSEAKSMSSALLTGAVQVYEINELRAALRQEQKQVGEQLEEARRSWRSLAVKTGNIEEELNGLREYLDAETRELSRLAHARRPLRVAAINGANIKTNNVLGTSTGGVAKVAAALESQAYAYSSLDGSCMASFVGDSDRNPLGQPVGHTRVISAIAYYGGIIYTGSQDCTVRAWDAEADRGWGKRTPIEAALEAEEQSALADAMARQQEEAEAAAEEGEEYVARAIHTKARDPQEMRRIKAGQALVMEGHTGTITCLAADHRLIISGSADKTAIIWHAQTGQLLRRLRGHEFAVSCVALDDNAFATGGADREVRLWKITKSTKKRPAKVVEMSKRLKGHTAPVTCVAIQGYELVSGSANGEIIVWDTEAGVIMRKHQVHTLNRPVFCVQFDAVKIVSAGADSRMVFTDIITGEAIQTSIRPHGDAHVLALSFDTERLLTIGADRTMRVWAMKGSEPPPIVKLHVLKPGEKMQVISRKYGAKLKDVMRWNGVTDVRDFYEGMRVIMAPPPGSEAYEAMVAEEEAARKAVEEAQKAREREAFVSGKQAVSDGGPSAEQALLDSILAKARDSELAQEAIDIANKAAAGATKRVQAALSVAGMSEASSFATDRGKGRKMAGSTNVWAKGSVSGAASTIGTIEEEGADPESTTVGAAIQLPSEQALVNKAYGQAPSGPGYINPSPSPFVRQATMASGGAPTPRPGQDLSQASVSSIGAQSSKTTLLRDMLAGGTGHGLQSTKDRDVKVMATAAATRLSHDQAKVAARSALSAQVQSSSQDHTY